MSDLAYLFGVVLVVIGTSLPELVTVVLSRLRGAPTVLWPAGRRAASADFSPSRLPMIGA